MTLKIRCPREAGKIIREGGLVAFPTETVFGLGANAVDSSAIRRLFEAKGRPSNNPLIVHLCDYRKWKQVALGLTPHAKKLLEKFSPGPISVVLPKAESISSLVTAGGNSVAIRVPSHPVANEILKEAAVPVAAPSANLSGRPSATSWKSVLDDLEGRIDAVFCEDCSAIGIESTVVDCRGESPIVLRPGAITLEQIQQLFPASTELTPGHQDSPKVGQLSVHSPGLLHPHYQPRANVHLLDIANFEIDQIKKRSAYCGLSRLSENDHIVMSVVFDSIEDYAAGFYEFLREVDRKSISDVYIERAPDSGLGRALLDRQRRASGEK